MASNLRDLGRLKWVMETSLTGTLAAKQQISVRQVYRFRLLLGIVAFGVNGYANLDVLQPGRILLRSRIERYSIRGPWDPIFECDAGFLTS